MAERTCSIPTCPEKHSSRGWCMSHYMAWYNYGDPLYRARYASDHEAFFAKVDKTGPLIPGRPDLGPCWPWTAAATRQGYGAFNASTERYSMGAHRWSYIQAVGPIPVGMTLDHLCHTYDLSCLGGTTCVHRRCVSPLHLEIVSSSENVSRGRKHNSHKTHCPADHPLTGDNVRLNTNGSRVCRACRREQGRRAHARKKAEAAKLD